MSQNAILHPFLAMLILTFMVWVVLYARRIPFLQNSGIDLNKITKKQLDQLPPAHVTNPADNLKNLFELPVLFYAVVLYLFTTSTVDILFVFAAWVFVAGRCLHSFVHCTNNVVMVRFGFYAVSSLALWMMVFRATWQLLGA